MAAPPSLPSQPPAPQVPLPRVVPPALANSTVAAAPVPTNPAEVTKDGISPDSLECRLPVELDVVVPVRDFRVRNLLALEQGKVIESQWNHSEDLPLSSGEVVLAWTEFEVVDTKLAVRVTRLV